MPFCGSSGLRHDRPAADLMRVVALIRHRAATLAEVRCMSAFKAASGGDDLRRGREDGEAVRSVERLDLCPADGAVRIDQEVPNQLGSVVREDRIIGFVKL